jgi:hypothetical protein
MISEKGTLRNTPAIKLLLTVFEQGLTGILYVKHDDVLKVLYFSRGKLIWAISNSDSDKLENILLAKNLVDPPTLQKVKKESHISESIGKVLVEKGLITLEELIDTSRDQLKRIIIDVLGWKDGGFQFIKDAPPERLLSLDLNITDFIIDYIIEEMDLSEVWKTIGSLQIELIKNPDEEKLEKYQLSDKQMELLNSFDGENRLESILSRHSGGHRESLLKIIYFFLMSELLIKKEFELNDPSLFESTRPTVFEEQIQDNDFPNSSTPPRTAPDEPSTSVSNTGSNVSPDLDGPFDIGDNFPEEEAPEPGSITGRHTAAYVFEEGQNLADDSAAKKLKQAALDSHISHVDQFKETSEILAKRSEIKPIKSDNSSQENQAAKNQLFAEEKKPVKWFNLILVLVFLILVLGGVLLLILPLLEDKSPMEELGNMAKSRENTAIINVEETTPKADDNKKIQETTEPGTETTAKKDDLQNTGQNTVQKPGEKETKSTNNVTDKKPEQKPELKPEPKKEIKPEKKTPPTPGKPAMDYFNEGNLFTAADIWRKELLKNGIKYAILLEMDCLKESVLHAFRQITRPKQFFILNRKSGRRSCFLVMWGKFRSQQEATTALKQVPNYFWKQKDPPEIVELNRYL